MAAPDPRDYLEQGTRQYLAALPDDEFAKLAEEIRQPADDKPGKKSTAEQFADTIADKLK